MTIWKFPLQSLDYQAVEMPHGGKILTVQIQNGNPCLWAVVDESFVGKVRHIFIVGTGHALPYWPMSYIGTFQLSGGALVFHVFEREAA